MAISVHDGTAAGLLLYLDKLMVDRTVDMSTGRAYRSAVKRVLGTGEYALQDVDVRRLDLDAAWHRFQQSDAASTVAAASLPSYRARLRRSIDMYCNWLDTGEGVGTTRLAAAKRGVLSDDRLVDYPFPVRPGVRAVLRLPERLTVAEVNRLATFVQALAVDAGDE